MRSIPDLLQLHHIGSLPLLYVTLRYTKLLLEGAWLLDYVAFHQIPSSFIFFAYFVVINGSILC
jgi:hypothetical protein